MKLIPVNTDQTNQFDIDLGLQGENLARTLVFDVSGWRAEYGEGTVQLLHRRAGDRDPYPAAIEQEGDVVRWPITAADTAMFGTGRLQLLYFVGETLVKQMIRRTFVDRSLGQPTGEAPEPARAWVEQVLAEAAKVTGMTATAVELPAGSEPTAEYANGVLTIGIPMGGDVSEAQIAQAVTGYLTEHPIEETDPTVPAWAKAAQKPSYTADEVGALSAETLPEAITTALAQAKESGAFDGAAGQDGITPTIGENGNWYLGDTDTGTPSRGKTGTAGADGRDGADGQPGADGKSAYQYAQDGGYTGTEAEFAAKLAEEMPDKLPNPNALTFTGAVTGSYDGSAPLDVAIPSGGGGSGKAKTEKLIDATFEEATAMVSVTLEHNFHRLYLVWHCGSNGVARIVDTDGNAASGDLCLCLDSTSSGWNERKIGQINGNTKTWQSDALLSDWTDDVSTFIGAYLYSIATGTSSGMYHCFGGPTAMAGTLGAKGLTPTAGRTLNVFPNAGLFAATTRIVLVGEYYE